MTVTAGATGAVAALVVVVLAARFRPVGAGRVVAIRRDGPSPTRRRAPRWSTVATGAVLAVSVSVVAGPGLALLTGGIVGGVIAGSRNRQGRRRRAAVEAAMPDAIELLVMSLHAGYSPTQALGRLALDAPVPLQPAFAAVEQRLHRASGFADALAELSTHCGRCALPLVNAMGAAVRDGLPIAPVLDRLTDEANASRRRLGEAAARRLPVRLSFPLVVCTLPSFVLLAIAPAVLGALSTLQGTSPP